MVGSEWLNWAASTNLPAAKVSEFAAALMRQVVYPFANFLGRPPFEPFARAAAALAGDLV